MIAQEILAYNKGIAIKESHSHHKSQSACSPQPRCLCIKKEKMAEVGVIQPLVLAEVDGDLWRKLQKIAEAARAVTVRERINLIQHIAGACLIIHQL